jgi:hypothetical protein
MRTQKLSCTEFPNDLSAHHIHVGCATYSDPQNTVILRLIQQDQDGHERPLLGGPKVRFLVARGNNCRSSIDATLLRD